MDAMTLTPWQTREARPGLARRTFLKSAAVAPVAVAASQLPLPALASSTPCRIELNCPDLTVDDATITGWVGGRHHGAHGDSTVNESVFCPDPTGAPGYALGVHLTGASPDEVEVHGVISGLTARLPAGRTGWAVPDGFQLFSIEPWPTGPRPGPGVLNGTTANIAALSAWNGTVTRDSKLILGHEVVRLYTTDYLLTGPVLPDLGARYNRGLGRPTVSPLEARAGYSPNRSGSLQQAVATLADGAHRFLVQTRGLVHAPESGLDILPVVQQGSLEITVRHRADGRVIARRSYALTMARVGV